MPTHDPELLSAFGRTVRRLRQERGWTQEELADRAGMHVTYISGIERGIRNVSLSNLARLAAGLGLPASDVLVATETGSDR